MCRLGVLPEAGEWLSERAVGFNERKTNGCSNARTYIEKVGHLEQL